MINNRVVCFLLFSIFIFSIHSSSAQSKNVLGAKFTLLPVPKKIEAVQGQPLTYDGLTGIMLEGIDKKPVLDQPLNDLKSASAAGKGILVLKIDSSSAPASAEGYILEIKNGYVTITAKSNAGLFYGAQTLSQLLEDAKDQNIAIPACRITDYPDIDYR